MRDVKAKGIAAMTASINDEHGDDEEKWNNDDRNFRLTIN